MRQIQSILSISLLVSIQLSACNEAPVIKQETLTSSPSHTIILPDTATPTRFVNFTPTVTPVRCNPLTDEFCIEDGNFVFQRPILPPGTITVDRSYPYGSTAGGTRDPHRGVEFYNGSGTPVFAAADGTVFYSGDDSETKFCPFTNFYGNLVILKHRLTDSTLYTLYAHLSEIYVSIGQSILAGEKIAEVGASGSAIGSHLHFEVRLDPQDETTTLNPELWLIPLPETGVLSMRFTDEQGLFVQEQTNLQYYPDPTDTFTRSWQPEPYSPTMDMIDHWENVVLGDLPEGQYRISYIWEGKLYERWVEIQANKLTTTAFEVH